MIATKPQSAQQASLVGMGESVFLQPEETARAVVGSCIGLALYHRRCKLAAVAHIVLPEAAGRSAMPGKFADTAIPHLVSLLENEGALRHGLIAKAVGGAQMFGGVTGPLQIGDANAKAVSKILAELAIPLEGQCFGGTKGRKFSFSAASGEMLVESAGEAPFTL
jgi:chemotaxis protein CheD